MRGRTTREPLLEGATELICSRSFIGQIAVVPESTLPATDTAFVVTTGTKPQDVLVIGIEEDGQKFSAHAAPWPPPAAQCGGRVEVGRLGDDICPELRETHAPRGNRRDRAHWAIENVADRGSNS